MYFDNLQKHSLFIAFQAAKQNVDMNVSNLIQLMDVEAIVNAILV